MKIQKHEFCVHLIYNLNSSRFSARRGPWRASASTKWNFQKPYTSVQLFVLFPSIEARFATRRGSFVQVLHPAWHIPKLDASVQLFVFSIGVVAFSDLINDFDVLAHLLTLKYTNYTQVCIWCFSSILDFGAVSGKSVCFISFSTVSCPARPFCVQAFEAVNIMKPVTSVQLSFCLSRARCSLLAIRGFIRAGPSLTKKLIQLFFAPADPLRVKFLWILILAVIVV